MYVCIYIYVDILRLYMYIHASFDCYVSNTFRPSQSSHNTTDTLSEVAANSHGLWTPIDYCRKKSQGQAWETFSLGRMKEEPYLMPLNSFVPHESSPAGQLVSHRHRNPCCP